ncbi:PaaI family thioesterase [Roseiarcus sp.]|uniref:PaaI family thioesterase n=1 Tax=Roseiarcus sp. TaxID=1969460 RepID=UPI003F992BB6
MNAARTTEEIERAIADVLAAAPHRAVGLALVRWSPGQAVLAFVAGNACLGPSGQVHGGVISMLAEPTAVLALLPMLPADRHAVTADFHAQFLRPAKPHARVELTGRVLRAGRQLAFCEVEARSERQVCVVTRVTKAIVAV